MTASDNQYKKSQREIVEEQAAVWVSHLDAHDPSGLALDHIEEYKAAEPDFCHWLKASTENRVAFLRLAGAWERADRLGALKSPLTPEVAEGGLPARVVSSSRHHHIIKWVMAAAAMVGILYVGLSATLWSPLKNYATEVGGRATVPMADGTKLELNTDTRLTVNMGKDERAIVLEKGEAFFDVAGEPGRPFVVYAADSKVTVLGTKFAVYKRAGELTVSVLEGKVQLENKTDSDVPEHPIILDRGDIAQSLLEDVLVSRGAFAEVERALSWRQGLLVFDNTSLLKAAAVFNRYNGVQLDVDPAVADMPIGGRFKADNVEAFARLLVSGFGLKAEKNQSVIKISGE